MKRSTDQDLDLPLLSVYLMSKRWQYWYLAEESNPILYYVKVKATLVKGPFMLNLIRFRQQALTQKIFYLRIRTKLFTTLPNLLNILYRSVLNQKRTTLKGIVNIVNYLLYNTIKLNFNIFNFIHSMNILQYYLLYIDCNIFV